MPGASLNTPHLSPGFQYSSSAEECASPIGSLSDVPAYANVLDALGRLKWYCSSHSIITIIIITVVLFALITIINNINFSPHRCGTDRSPNTTPFSYKDRASHSGSRRMRVCQSTPPLSAAPSQLH